MEIERNTFERDGEEYRLYWQLGEPTNTFPSVTTVLKSRDTDMSNLEQWQDDNDGIGDNADHEHIFWYKRNRGTLLHWYALKTLDPDLEWSSDEAQSMWALGNISSQNDPEDWPETHDARPRDVLYSVLKSQDAVESWGEFYDRHDPEAPPSYYEDELVAQYERDRDFFVEAFERICSKLDITRENVIAIEEFLFEDDYGYAGQVDLVYENDTGTVVADLKTSSGCYSKHKLQGAAYGKAIENDDDLDVDEVDRLEVIRIHPDSGQYAVHTDDPSHGIHESTYWRRSYDDLWDEFETLASEFPTIEEDK